MINQLTYCFEASKIKPKFIKTLFKQESQHRIDFQERHRLRRFKEPLISAYTCMIVPNQDHCFSKLDELRYHIILWLYQPKIINFLSLKLSLRELSKY